MQHRLRRKLASYLSATLLLSLLSSGIIAPTVTTESAKADLVQPTAPSLDLNNECDQNDISTSFGVYIKKVGSDCVIQFRAVGTYSWRVPEGVSSVAELLVVGGGGGGGARHGGGGGAGGYVYKENVAVSPNGSISIVVGNGGARTNGYGANGQDSLFNNAYRAKGGGGGGSGGSSYQGAAGGSGGGATGNGAAGTSNQRSTGDTSGLGNAGGAGTGISPTKWTGGGGGGSAGAGTAGNSTGNSTGGNGGAGTLNDITGEFVCYAAGGGGGTNELGTVGQGGGCINPIDSAVMTVGAQGGNNAWGASYQRDLDAGQNSGSGGGGGGFTTNVRSELGGAGGSGVVIVRYKLPTAGLDLNAANYSGTGTTWVDSSTSSNNGVLQNSPTFVRADASNPSFFRFDGTKSQYVSTSKAIAWPGPRNFSGGVWFRTSSNQAAKIIGFENTQTGTGTGSYDRHLYIGTDNRLYWGVYDGFAYTVKTTQKVNDGKWHYAFFTSTWTYAGSIISLSLDNGPAQSLSMGTAQPYTGYWRIGGYQMNGWSNARTGYYTGDIARATIYPYVLSPEKAQEKFFEMQAPTQVTAIASTTAVGIKASWTAVPGATGYKVNVYNASGSALVSSISNAYSNETATSVTLTTGVVANTGYRVSVTPLYATAPTSRTKFSTESAKTEIVVPGSAACSPIKTISGPYTILKFNTSNNLSSSCQWTAPNVTTPIEYLVVGGGGGGAQNHGAGGQGGYYNAGQLTDISGSTVTITVGSGGAGGFNARNDSLALQNTANPLRNGQDGSPSALTTSSRAIVASGGAGGLTTWENQTCRVQSAVNPWYPAKAGTPVVGRDGLAGGPSGAPRASAAGDYRNPGAVGLSALSLSFNSVTSFSTGGAGGNWGGTETLGSAGVDHFGNGGQGGSSACFGGGRGGSGTVVLRYLTPLPKAASALITLPETGTSAIYARFLASDFNTMTKTWEDSSGNNRDAYVSGGNPRLEAVKVGTNNAKNDFVAVTGTPSDKIRFFALPKQYTLFHVARYNGANKNRIFQGTGTNWLSGFWASRVGVAYHSDWLTANGLENNKNPETDWIISTDKRNSYRSQGVDRTVKNATYQTNPVTRFGINDSEYGEYSDFQVAEVIVYNRELTSSEVAEVEKYLQQKYTYQNPDIIGNVAGGGWVPSQYCPAGQVAVGVNAHRDPAGFSKFRMICQSLHVGGESTTGVSTLTTKADIGGATNTAASIYCNNSTSSSLTTETQTSVIKGIRFARGTTAGSQDYYVAGLRLICGPLVNISETSTETNFFSANAAPESLTTVSGARSYYPTPNNPALCPSGQVVIGFNAKSGSVTDAIQTICGVLPLSTLKKPTLAAGAGALKTLVATWETITTASSYTINLYDTSSTPILIETSGLANVSKDVNTFTITSANFPEMKDSTPYRITVTANGDGINTLYSPESTISDQATTLTSASAPTWSAGNAPGVNGSDSKTVTPGMSLTIYETVTVGGSDQLQYQWFKDGKLIPGATDTNLTVSAITSDSAGVYTVKVTNTFNGSSASSTSPGFTLDVLDVITPQTGITKISSNPFSLKIETKGLRAKTFSMSNADSAAVTALGLTLNSSTGVISGSPTVGVSDSATIQVTVSSYDTSVTTAPFRLKFVASALESPTSVTLVPGSTNLKELVTTWKKVDSATAYSILLYDSSSTLVSTRGLDSIAGTPLGASSESRTTTITTSNFSDIRDGETYTVRVIALDANGLYADSDSSSTAMAVTALPPSALNLFAIATLSPSGELKIAGTPVTFGITTENTGGGTLTYQWYRDGLLLINETAATLSFNVTNGDAGTYTAEVTNTLFGESVKVTSSGQTISVVDGVKIVKPINGLVTTKNKPYRLQLSASAGTSPITFNIASGYSLPTGLALNSDSGLVTGTPTVDGFFPIKIVARDANNSYDTTTVFTISVVETQLDSATVTTRPTANTLKSIDVEWSAVANANRYVVRLYEESATNSSGSDPLAEISGITSTSYKLTTSDYVQLEDNTRYKVSVVAVDANGRFGDSSESTYVAVTTNRAPTAPVFTVSPTQSVAQGLGTTVTLTSLATATGAITYQWYKDEVEVVGATSANLVIPSLAEKDAGSYSVVATATLNGVSASTTAETATALSVSFSVVTPTEGLTGAVGKDFTLGIQTVGGEAQKTFAVTSGTLPEGLSLSEATGEISGNPDTTTTGTAITVSVTSGSTTLTTSFTLKVVIPTKTKIATVTSEATPGVLKSIRVNWAKEDATTHMVHLYDNGGSLLKSFVTYDTATGTSFTITPNEYSRLQDGTEYKIGVIAVGDASTGNAEESDLVTVKTNAAPERPTVIQQPENYSVAIGGSVTLSAKATINDSGALSYQWFKGSDIIPGATSDSYTIAAITTSDLASYRVRVTNTLNGGTSSVNSQNGSVAVLTDLKAITPTTGLKLRTGIPYRLSVQSTGGAGVNTWSVSDGLLPTGLTLDSTTALITGTPSDSLTVGTVYTITLQVKDRYNATSKTEPFTLTLVESTSVLAAPTLTAIATRDTTKSISLEWTQVESATSYSVYLYDSAGTLIATKGLTGLTGSSIASTTINANNYADIAASTKYLVSVVANYDGDLAIGASPESTRKEVTTGTNLTPPPAQPLPVAPPAAPTPQVGPALIIIPGAPFNIQVDAPGANNFKIEGGRLPAGLTLDPATGRITGTPTESGPYNFSILATPPVPGKLITYSGNITTPAAPTPGPELVIVPGEPFNAKVDVPGATDFTIYGGRLPAGLVLDPKTGEITGTPTESGPYDFTILATPPATGKLVNFKGTIVAPQPEVQPTPALEIKPGSTFDYTPNVPGANNFVIKDGALPAGLTLDPATGRISGTPRESGPYNFSILATPPAKGVLLTFSGSVEAPNSTVVDPVVNPTIRSLDPITPATAVLPTANSNLLVVSSGEVGTTTVLPNSAGNGLIITSPDVILSVAGVSATGSPTPLNNEKQLTLQAGLQVEASGTGFLPDSEIFVYVFSTPQLIGKIKTDANGDYSAKLTVPATLAGGNHVLQVNGFLKSNEVKSISLAVIVNKPVDPTKPGDNKPSTKPVATKSKKIAIGSSGKVISFKSGSSALTAAAKKLIKKLKMPKGKEVYVLGYASNSGRAADILVALNRAIAVSQEIKRLNPKAKVGYAGMGTKTATQCVKVKNLCAVVTVR